MASPLYAEQFTPHFCNLAEFLGHQSFTYAFGLPLTLAKRGLYGFLVPLKMNGGSTGMKKQIYFIDVTSLLVLLACGQ